MKSFNEIFFIQYYKDNKFLFNIKMMMKIFLEEELLVELLESYLEDYFLVSV